MVDLSHANLKQRHIEIRISKHLPLKELYHLIHQKTDSTMDDQILQVLDVVGELLHPRQFVALRVARRGSARRLLWYSAAARHMQIHCVDTTPHAISARGALENVALVEKYRMSDAEYAQR